MDEAAFSGFITGALATGSMAHMPHMPMSDAEADALAHYLISVSK
jgi:hypothetical protein